MADAKKKGGARQPRETRRGKHKSAAARNSADAAPGTATPGKAAGRSDSRLSQSSDNMDKFAVSGEVRNAGMAMRRSDVRRLPTVDANGPDRERAAWSALAAFGAGGASRSKPAQPVVSSGKPQAQARGAATGDSDGIAADLVAEDAATDVGVDGLDDETDVDREWADSAPTVRDSAPGS